MSFLSSLFGQRAIDAGDFDIGDPMWRSVSDSGEKVDTETAIRLVSVYACITLIADAIRALPVDVFRKQGDSRVAVTRGPGWLPRPNNEQTWGQFIDFAAWSLLTHGNAFIFLGARDTLGFPTEMHVIKPDTVKVQRTGGEKVIIAAGVRMTEYTPAEPLGNVLHIIGYTADGLVGLSPIEQAQQAIGTGLALEKYGNKFFANGATPSAVLEMPAGSNPTQPQLESLAKQFDRKHGGANNAWKPIVLANGASYKPMAVPNSDAQFLESQKFNVSQIARLYRVPPHLIGDVERSTSWGTGIEEQNIGFVTYTLMPWITRFEEAFTEILPRGQFLKFNVNALLRGDVKTRAAFYQVMGALKTVTVNEIRAFEDLPPFEDGDEPPPAPNESI